MGSGDATELAFYPEHDCALRAVRLIHRVGSRRAAANRHLQPDRITDHDAHVSLRRGALTGAAVALVVLMGLAALSVAHPFRTTVAGLL